MKSSPTARCRSSAFPPTAPGTFFPRKDDDMYRHAALLAAIAMGATGCAGTVGEVQDRVEPVVEAGIAEIKARKDQQFRRWRKLREWADAYACILSKGAIERNATPEERETIDNTRCAP